MQHSWKYCNYRVSIFLLLNLVFLMEAWRLPTTKRATTSTAIAASCIIPQNSHQSTPSCLDAPILLRALQSETVERTPVWLMRQVCVRRIEQ